MKNTNKNTNNVLIVVDVQNDFIKADGKLSVPGAEKIISNIQKRINDKKYDKIVYTMDTHIKEEYEKSEEAKMFPLHCEFNTDGWELSVKPNNKSIKNLIKNSKTKEPIDFTVRNEYVFMKDKFSVWEGNNNYEMFIKSFPKDTVFDIVGVATNYCVFMNVMGMVDRGFKVNIIDDCIKEIPDESFDENVKIMKDNNVKFINNNIEEGINYECC